MPVTATLIPAQLIASDNIQPMGVTLTELSDGHPGTGMITNPADGILQMHFSDIMVQQLFGSTIAINIKSNAGEATEFPKAVVDVRYSKDGGSNFISLSEYIIIGQVTDERSIVIGTVNNNAEENSLEELTSDDINNIIISISLSVGIVHDLNITIDDGTGGRIRIEQGRVFFREGRIRI
jgi:hypothetical protein